MIRLQSLALLLLALCSVGAVRPGCRTRYELRMKWTVQDTPSRYWECQHWAHAVQRTCPTGSLFSAAFQRCVPDSEWVELPYFDPPTTVTDYKDVCVEVPQECTCVQNPCDGGIVIDDVCFCDPGMTEVGGVCRPIECGDGFQLIDGTCQQPVSCVGGVVTASGDCLCPGPNYEWTDGVCLEIITECEEYHELINGACFPQCGGGDLINGICQCYGDSYWENGRCVTPRPDIDYCWNGQWNAVDLVCVCPSGYELLNGWCVNVLGICRTAPESAYEPGEHDCDVPKCTLDEYGQNTLFPLRDPETFWQCKHDQASLRACAPGTCFDFYRQTCVHPVQWRNSCRLDNKL